MLGLSAVLLFVAVAAIAAMPLQVGRLVGIGLDPLAPLTGLMRFAFDVLGRVVIVCLALTAFLLMFLGSANAQDAVSTAVDLGPLAQLAIEIVAPVALAGLSAIAGWLMLQVRKRTGLDIDARHRAAVDQALDRGIGYAVQELEDRIAGGIPFASKSRATVAAAAYARKAIPDALKHFKIDGQRLSEMVEARLEGLLVDPKTERAERPARIRSGPSHG